MSNGDSCIARPELPHTHHFINICFNCTMQSMEAGPAGLEVTSCSVSCGGGTKVLVQECNESVPAHGGNDCDGLPYRVERCNTCPCEPIKRLRYNYVTVIDY